jgi:hypothetical protein
MGSVLVSTITQGVSISRHTSCSACALGSEVMTTWARAATSAAESQALPRALRSAARRAGSTS